MSAVRGPHLHISYVCVALVFLFCLFFVFLLIHLVFLMIYFCMDGYFSSCYVRYMHAVAVEV